MERFSSRTGHDFFGVKKCPRTKHQAFRYVIDTLNIFIFFCGHSGSRIRKVNVFTAFNYPKGVLQINIAKDSRALLTNISILDPMRNWYGDASNSVSFWKFLDLLIIRELLCWSKIKSYLGIFYSY